MVLRTPHGQGQIPLEARHAMLLTSLRERPLVDSLAILERHCPKAERGTLPHAVQRWLAQSVELELWARVVPARTEATPRRSAERTRASREPAAAPLHAGRKRGCAKK